MQVFEFHFNPKLKPDFIFDSFCYEPENIYEKRMGNLYLVGSLKNVLPQNFRFLDQLTKVLKEKYYSPVLHSSEKSLKESLKQANEFLEKIAKEGDVSWLGNLSFAVLSLKNFELNFTKVGDLKIFLLRGSQIIDIDKKLKFQEIEPYPLKIFGNIVSGKLTENDIILILTKEVADYFQGRREGGVQSQDLLNEIAKILPFEQKKLKEIFRSKKEELSKISGICLIIFLSKEELAKRREAIFLQPQLKEFSLRQVFAPLVKTFQKLKTVKGVAAGWLPQIKFPKIIISKVEIYSPLAKKSSALLNIFKIGVKTFLKNKNVILILVLIFFLTLGFFIFEKKEKEQLKEYQATLNQIQEKVSLAESFLILKTPEATKEANSLLKESWQELSPLASVASTLPSSFEKEIFQVKNTISQNLYELNKLKIVEEPEVLFEFNPEEYIPQKIIIFGESLYFFSPYSQNLFKVNQKGEGKLILTNQKFNSAVLLEDSILFFLKPNKLINFKNEQFGELFSLETPYPDFNFNDFSLYKSNLYFLDRKTGEIIKYPFLGGLKWGPPQFWLTPQTKKAIEAGSLAVDGSIWILNKQNSIDRYYAGRLSETLSLDFFPYPKEFSKIFTLSGLSYLYLLEPGQNRIVILNKAGQVIKQFQSQKFDNLLDFSVSKDGKMIYLLNGLKVYQIKF